VASYPTVPLGSAPAPTAGLDRFLQGGGRGGAGAAGAARPLHGQRRTPAAASQPGGFEVILSRPVPEQEVPEGGEPITIPASPTPVPVVELIDAIAAATDWNIVVSKGVGEETVQVWLQEVTPRQALEVLRHSGMYCEFDPDTRFLFVMLESEYLERTYGDIKHREFQIKHGDLLDMQTTLTELLSPQGKIIADPRTGYISVWDTEDNIEAIQNTVDRVDVELAPQIFQLKYVSAESLAESIQSLLSDHGLAHADSRANAVVVTDVPSRVDQIALMIEALDKRLETRTWTLDYADVDSVTERIENLFPEELVRVSMDEETRQVSVTAIPEQLDEIGIVVDSWDIKGRQVSIQAYLVSVSDTVRREFGIDWSYFDEISGVPFSLQSGNASPDYTTSPDAGEQRAQVGRLPNRVFERGLFGGRFSRVNVDGESDTGSVTPDQYILDPEFKGNRVGVVLNYLDRTADLDILSQPRVTVRDGEEASFQNIREIPYQEGGYSTYNNSTTNDGNYNRVIPLRVQFVEVGTVLKVKPRIADEGNVRLDIEAESSTADEDFVVTVGDQTSTIPLKTMNKAETKVMVHDGETIVIGGLRSTNLDDSVDRVPVLGDLPFIGKLFSTTRKTHEERELMVFITPILVDEYTRPEAERLAQLDADASARMRHSQKSVFGRAADKVTGGRNELDVAIGQNGSVYAEGAMKRINELADTFAELRGVPKAKVIIRAHPEAPHGVCKEVAALAREAGLEVVEDDTSAPFVPRYPEDSEQ
jgi:type II secretory pathway component GspD/PulD (secretin)